MRIAEPATILTDYLLAAVSLFLAWRVMTLPADAGTMVWGITFFLLGVTALIGGTYHGFQHQLSRAVSQRVWQSTVYLAALTSAAVLYAAAAQVTTGVVFVVLTVLACIKCVISCAVLYRNGSFRFVVYDYGFSLILVALLYGMYAQSLATAYMIGGIIVLLGGSLVQVLKLAPHRYFNHNDLYHVIQIVAIVLMYCGVVVAAQH